MSDLPNQESAEMKELSQKMLSAGCEGNFIAFLRYCSERLKKGDSVQAIWNDYQAKAL